MTRQIDTDAVTNSIRLKEQGSAPSTPAAGYGNLYTTAAGLKYVDDNGVAFGPLSTGQIPGGRLTLTTATPVTTADVNNATTVYYTPYHSDIITLYDGERWIPLSFTEKSLAVGAFTASKPYDIWGYISSGALALDSTVWTDGTTRATALAYQDGRLVKSGAATRRYLGTIYIDSDQKTDDAEMKRFVWNYYNRRLRRLYDYDETSHTYNSATARSWNNDATIRVELIVGVAEEPLEIYCNSWASADADARYPQAGVGIDITNGTSINYSFSTASQAALIGINQPIAAPAAGYHYLQAIERAPSGQCTFAGIYYGALLNC